MGKPWLIIHNSISLDGSLLGFEVDMGLHYGIAGKLKADAYLVGSNTARSGIKLFHVKVPRERPEDMAKPVAGKGPLWVVPDTTGKLRGVLHVLRGSGYCRDVAVVVSKSTPRAYLEHLRERHYDTMVLGRAHPDYADVLKRLADRYGVRRVLTDSGRVLNGILLDQGLADEVSLLVHPVVVGVKRFGFWDRAEKPHKLKLLMRQNCGGGKVWLRYLVLKGKGG